MNRHVYLLMMLSVLLMVVGGCQKPLVDPLLISAKGASQLDYRIQWQEPLELGAGNRFLDVQVVNRTVIALESGNVVTLMQDNDGMVLWRVRVASGSEKLFKPVVGSVGLVVSSERYIYIYRMQNGELSAKIPLERVVRTAPVLDGNYAIFGSGDGQVVAQDLHEGFPRWRYQMGAGILADPIRAGNFIVVADGEGGVAAFNPLSGSILWRKIGPPWKAISAGLATDGMRVFAACEDRALYAFNARDGRFWKHLTPDPLKEAPIVIGGQVLLSSGNGLTALDVESGAVIWERPGLKGTPVMARGNKLLVSQRYGIVIVDRNSGETIERVDLPKVHRVMADRPVDGNLYLINDDGRIMKMSPG